MNVRKLRLMLLVLELVGIVAIVLPFAWYVSPLQAIINPIKEFAQTGSTSDWNLMLLGTPTLLAIPVILLSIRLLVSKSLTSGENWTACVLGIAGTAMPIVFLVDRSIESSGNFSTKDWLVVFLILLLSFSGVFLTVRMIVKGVSRECLASAALRYGYLPNAFICLVEGSQCFRSLHWLDIGAAYVSATVVLYSCEVVYFTKIGFKAIPTERQPWQTSP